MEPSPPAQIAVAQSDSDDEFGAPWEIRDIDLDLSDTSISEAPPLAHTSPRKRSGKSLLPARRAASKDAVRAPLFVSEVVEVAVVEKARISISPAVVFQVSERRRTSRPVLTLSSPIRVQASERRWVDKSEERRAKRSGSVGRDMSKRPRHTHEPGKWVAAIAPVAMPDFGRIFASEVTLDEEEDEAQIHPNARIILACVTPRVGPPILERIRKVLRENSQKHYVLLLLEPGLSVEGVYALAPSLQRLTKIWGDTPETITPDEPVRFWMYNGLTDGFVEQEEHSFSPFTDAVSM
jgi:hypothetical protein